MGGMRRSGRIAKEIRILLLGTNTSGRVFSEETRTVVLSRHGAGIVSTHKVAPDETLTLRVLGASASTEAEVRLVGPMGEDGRGYIYGVAFADPDFDFWQIKFPLPPQWVGDSDSTLTCSICHTREAVQQSEIEADVYALAGGILRLCQECGNSTVWREASADAVPRKESKASPHSPVAGSHYAGATESANEFELESTPVKSPRIAVPPTPALVQAWAERAAPVQIEAALSETVSPAALPPVETGVVPRTSNRRRDVRTRVSFTACIRQGDGGEEIVECDNVSRGGISFRSRKCYAVESAIEVAAPYSLGSHAIFAYACIKRVESLPGGTLFRYGAAYTAQRKPG